MNYRVPFIYKKTKDERVVIEVPGSKSVTVRAILLAALAHGESTLYGVQFSDDCATFIDCIKLLGIGVYANGTTLKIRGCGGRLPVKEASINVGSAGTAARFLPALLAFQNGRYTVDCSEQMKRRPIAPLLGTLRELGAKFTFLDEPDSFPFIIEGAAPVKTELCVDIGASSQFLSALLISAVCAGKAVRIKPVGSHGMDYVRMTVDMMWSFGVTVAEEDGWYTVCGEYSGKKYDVEPDVSAACYFYAANKILGTDIRVKGLLAHSMQGDVKFIELLKNFDGGRIDMHSYSDQVLTLAAIAPYFSKPTEICNVAHIRRQECDRISAIVKNLTAMKVRCEEREDGVKIYPSQPMPARIETFGDHRVAMSFTLTGLRADGVVIEDAEVCSKTFREYFSVWDELSKRLIKSR